MCTNACIFKLGTFIETNYQGLRGKRNGELGLVCSDGKISDTQCHWLHKVVNVNATGLYS